MFLGVTTIPSSIYCKNCQWEIPEDLIDNLIKNLPIYCEKCGILIEKNDYNEADLERVLRPPIKNSPSIDRKKIKKTGKKLYKTLKSKLSNLKEKYQERE
ncbi:MAG: hypothetical protein EU548_00615 [Promethearchaeota archaeon]|nr:MAG: hypothetical protein EU548_00615 [Candidatus Lokiarchaeota archaeon]